MGFDIERVRAEFPALAVQDEGRPRVYFDNPAGTQVPRRVIDAMTDCLVNNNANLGGYFVTTRRAGEIVDGAHAAMRDFLNAGDAGEIVFGQNSTSLVFALSRSIAHELKPGDEIVLSRMDHDANVAPWLLLAEDRGLTVRWWEWDRERYELPLAALDRVLTPRTRVVAVTHASNAIGTLVDIPAVAARTRASGALLFVDAVQTAPHMALDVQQLGCDFLVCSPYKFYGPHQGVLYGRRAVLERLRAWRTRPAGDELPSKFETGTLSHEGMAGTTAAVEHMAWMGRTVGGAGEGADRRSAIVAGYAASRAHEEGLTKQLLAGLAALPGVQVLGIADAARIGQRVPTVSFLWEPREPAAMAKALAGRNIFVWSGHNYAVEVYRALGREQTGGLRVGFAHYNAPTEVDRLLAAMDSL